MPTSRGGAQRTISAQLACFCLVGATGTTVHYAVFLTMVQLLGLPVVSSAMGFVLGASVNFILNHRLTFASTKAYNETVLRFFVVACVGLALNVSIMALCITIFKLHYLVSQIVATGLVLLWNFLGNRIWTFKK